MTGKALIVVLARGDAKNAKEEKGKNNNFFTYLSLRSLRSLCLCVRNYRKSFDRGFSTRRRGGEGKGPRTDRRLEEKARRDYAN